MITQPNSYSCGPCAIVNACLALGHEHTFAEVSALAGTTGRDGTDEKGILAALNALQYHTEVLTDKTASRFAVFWRQLLTALDRGETAILCVDGVDHWVAVTGKNGGADKQRLVVFDSQESPDGNVFVYDEAGLTKRLGGSRYAILVGEYQDETDSLGRDVMRSLAGLVATPRMDPNVDLYLGNSLKPGEKITGLMPDAAADYIFGARVGSGRGENE